MTRPHTEGHYWAKQTTGDYPLSEQWEVVQTFDNGGATFDLRVFVPGVEKSQDVDDFTWGPRVIAPAGCVE